MLFAVWATQIENPGNSYAGTLIVFSVRLHTLSVQLQTGLKNLKKNCTMQGPILQACIACLVI